MKTTLEERKRKNIKSFIYLDEYKMYSISSQIFEGLTESVTSYSRTTEEDQERQRGPVGSGRVLADIIGKESSTEERKFLHDYSYSLFEEKIIEEDRVLHIDSDNIHDAIKDIEDYNFVAVSGRVLFNDIRLVNGTLENINNLLDAVIRIQLQSNDNLLKQYKNEANRHKSGKKSAKSGFSVEKRSYKESPLLTALKEDIGGKSFDEDFLQSLSTVLNYGYEDQFETRTYLESEEGDKYLFSTILQRIHLREAEALIVKKYSRFSEKDFTIVGTITQNRNEQSNLSIQHSPAPEAMKEAVMQLTLGLSEIEKQFTGKLNNEIVIDPIAIYREL